MQSDARHDEEWATVGERIRLAREAKSMSVRELSRRVDVSPSHVSQVERGLASFSVRALYTVANELGISMDSLFESEPSAPVVAAPDEAQVDDWLERSGVVLRRQQRPALHLAAGPRWERLTAKPEPTSEFIEVIYAPAPGAKPPADFVRHTGREWGLISAGRLNVQVGFAETVLEEGDSIVFDCSIPHRFWNSSAEEVRAIWFVQDQPDDSPDDVSVVTRHR